MKYEYQAALTDLDRRTHVFFRREIFVHGNPETPQAAREILSTLGTSLRTVRVLREVLHITNTDDVPERWAR